MSDYTIGVVGNPDCGKTTLFNALTGAKQRVGNWPGVTVDRKVRSYRYGGHRIEVVDTHTGHLFPFRRFIGQGSCPRPCPFGGS
jgi:small GTP-binding protein